jgi:prevent-host-death family protein
MKTVNALKIRNQLGEVLDMLDTDESPILIEKRKKIRAVLISYDDFRTRFVDKLAEEEKRRFVAQISSHAAPSLIGEDPLQTLRSLRGYED